MPTLETLVRARHPDQAEPLHSALLALADQDPLMHARPVASDNTALLLYGEVRTAADFRGLTPGRAATRAGEGGGAGV